MSARQLVSFVGAVLLVAALLPAPLSGAPAQGQGTVKVGIDVDTAGNSATSLGTPQACRSVERGQQFRIDIFVDAIPEGRSFAGFNYVINYDKGRAQVVGSDHDMLLAAEEGSQLTDLSEQPPDSDGKFQVAVADFGTEGQGPLAGVLGRYSLEALSSAPKGTFPLSLSMVAIVGNGGGIREIPVGQIVNANISVGEPCDAAAQTPAITAPEGQPSPGEGSPEAAETPGATPTEGTPVTQETPSAQATPTAGPGTPAADATPGAGTDGARPAARGEDEDGFPWLAVIIGIVVGGAAISAAGAFAWYRLRGR